MKIGDGRARLVVLEGMQISTPLDPYLSLRALASYGCCSVRWLADRLRDPQHPLPHYRLPGASGKTKTGKIVVRRSEFDEWIARYRQVGDPQVGRIVAEILDDLR